MSKRFEKIFLTFLNTLYIHIYYFGFNVRNHCHSHIPCIMSQLFLSNQKPQWTSSSYLLKHGAVSGG